MNVGGQIQMVRFRAGGYEVLAEARQITAMRTTPVAGARAVEDLLGLPAADLAPRCWLILRDGGGAVEVGGPARLEALAATRLHPQPPLLAARQELRGVVAVALPADGSDDGRASLVVDLESAWEKAPG